jgi:hypothetical protein
MQTASMFTVAKIKGHLHINCWVWELVHRGVELLCEAISIVRLHASQWYNRVCTYIAIRARYTAHHACFMAVTGNQHASWQ